MWANLKRKSDKEYCYPFLLIDPNLGFNNTAVFLNSVKTLAKTIG